MYAFEGLLAAGDVRAVVPAAVHHVDGVGRGGSLLYAPTVRDAARAYASRGGSLLEPKGAVASPKVGAEMTPACAAQSAAFLHELAARVKALPHDVAELQHLVRHLLRVDNCCAKHLVGLFLLLGHPGPVLLRDFVLALELLVNG